MTVLKPTMDQISACPFCGTKSPRILLIENINGWHVECDGCDARTYYQSTAAQACMAWNRRLTK